MQTRILSVAIASSLTAGLFAIMPFAQAATPITNTATAPVSLIATAGPNNANAQVQPIQPNDNDQDTINCEMDFNLTGWSVFYKSASGNGTVKCTNGQKMKVVIDVTGGGLTVGRYHINDGQGNFTDVSDISQVLGSYAMATAHAGAVKSAHSAVMTNGTATLTITGTGNGWNVGVGFAAFKIKRASLVPQPAT